MLGGAYGQAAQLVFPGLPAFSGAYAMVGMAAVFAGSARAPITAVIILFEMTQDYHVILPLMLATVISTILSIKFEPESIYTLKLKLRGIDIESTKEESLLRRICVMDAMTPVSDLATLKPSTPISELVHLFQETSHHGFVVLDDNDELYGLVAIADLERAIASEKAVETVGDICETNVMTAYSDEFLDDALRHFGALDVGRIPVVDRSDPRHVVGMLRRTDIVRSLSSELLRKQGRAHHIERLRMETKAGAELVELFIDKDDAANGKYLREISLPDECVIVSIQRGKQVVVPRGHTKLLTGDRVIAFVAEGMLDRLMRVIHEGIENNSQTN
jgi:CIC family chloride channel protein